MKTLKLIAALGTCLWLSACILDPGRGWDGPRHHHYDGDGGRGGPGNGFCPPGQAKKGNC